MGFWTQGLGHRIQGDASQVDLLCKEFSSFAKKGIAQFISRLCVQAFWSRVWGFGIGLKSRTESFGLRL